MGKGDKKPLKKEALKKDASKKDNAKKIDAEKKNRALEENLKTVKKTLEKVNRYYHASRIVGFDQQTLCPGASMEAQGEVGAFLQNEAFTLVKDKKFIKAGEALYKKRDELDKLDAVLAKALHREYLQTKNVTPKQQKEFSLTYNKAFVDWIEAKNKSDFSLFKGSLSAVRTAELKKISLMEEAKPEAYDNLLNIYERGIDAKALDEIFGQCKERLIPFLQKIVNSKKKIRTDFMSRPAAEEAQKKLSYYLLDILHYDLNRGALAVSEHPFTDELDINDVRITTHYYPDNFASSMYSVIHETGHALFGQNIPAAHYKHFIQNEKTLGMHESVSRFYENRIARSRSFVKLIFNKLKELLPNVLEDVTEEELYEALNTVTPSTIRIEADEFTYTFHIIIRYEIEKELINNGVKIEDLPKLWSDKYEEYLGVRPSSDKEGVLQDVHWTSGFGYFPTYAIGNMYNAMYYNKMSKKHDVNKLIEENRIDVINEWMTKHVFKKADRLDPADWIRDITGKELTPVPFLDYLEEKFGAIYGL